MPSVNDTISSVVLVCDNVHVQPAAGATLSRRRPVSVVATATVPAVSTANSWTPAAVTDEVTEGSIVVAP